MIDYRKSLSVFTRAFGILMVLVYAGVGVLFLFNRDFLFNVTGYTRYIIGILLILYSAFRVYRIIVNKEKKD